MLADRAAVSYHLAKCTLQGMPAEASLEPHHPMPPLSKNGPLKYQQLAQPSLSAGIK